MKYLKDFLTASIENNVGFEEAEILYSELFRSSEVFSINNPGEYFEVDEVQEILMDLLTEDIYEYYEYDNPFPEVYIKGMSPEDAQILIDGGIAFVELCNYKGESEGFVLEKFTENLRVFHSKYKYS